MEHNESEPPEADDKTTHDPIAHGEKNAPVVHALLQNPTEDNIAIIFATLYEGDYVYVHGAGKWFKWTGAYWREDITAQVRDDIRWLSRKQNSDGKIAPSKASFINGVEALLKSDPVFARHISEFDKDNYLLNTPDFTIDLRTGDRRVHNQADNITRITSVSPRIKGGERFLQFIDEITDGDKELAHFHQVSLGACLSGAVESHWLLFWFGSTSRNGKNTLGDLVAWILGGYAGSMPTSALMQGRYQDHATEMMTVMGKRLVVSSEVPEGDFWNEARLKETTGDTTLKGRYMRQDWVEFRRTHKHLIYGNHRPQLRAADSAVRARFRLVPFPVSFLGREDRDLPDQLREEAHYVLHWLIEGHQIWLENGKELPLCDAVTKSSEEYFKAQSTIDLWLEERCELVDNPDLPKSHLPKAGAIYADYKEWKYRRGEQAVSQSRWGEWMGQRFSKENSNGVRYRGLKLLYLNPLSGY